MMLKVCKVFILASALLGSRLLFAQTDSSHLHEAPLPKFKEDKVLKFNLNDEGTRWFQVTFLNQVWIRYNESNPGTTVMGESSGNTFDIGLRRTRIQMFGQVTDRAFIYFQFGQNNFNRMTNSAGTAVAGNRKIAAFFHDALCEYRLSKGNQLKLGAGLTITNGLSRFSNPSVGTILALDLPIFAQATVDQTDLFSRKLSVYARGQLGKLDYRFSLSDPFPVTTSGSLPALNTTNATFALKGHSLQYQSYLTWQFWEKEAHTTPYLTGSYLGKKKVFNLSAGIIYQPGAMWIKNAVTGDTIRQQMLLWAVETFMDTPLNKAKGTAITAYAGYFNYDFGTHYVRVSQQMNPADGPSVDPKVSNIVSRGGNGFPMTGTGNTFYFQFGYLFKRDLLGTGNGTFQPYCTWQINDFAYLNKAAHIYDIGVNWLMSGHKSKISFDIQSRPVYFTDLKPHQRKQAYVLQYQIFI